MVNMRLREIAITPANLPSVLEEYGVLDNIPYDIEDKD